MDVNLKDSRMLESTRRLELNKFTQAHYGMNLQETLENLRARVDYMYSDINPKLRRTVW